MLYGDWVSQIFAFFIVVCITMGFNRFGTALYMLFFELTDNLRAATLVYSVFLSFSCWVVFPLVSGLVNFEMCFLERGKSRLSDLFFAFESSVSFLRYTKASLFAFLKILLYLAPCIALYIFNNEVYTDGCLGFTWSVYGQDGVYFALSALFLLLAFAGFVLSAKCFMGIYVSIQRPDLKISQCFFVANICMRAKKRELSNLALSFLPLLAISLFTLGFLFVMYVFPYIAISLTSYSKYIYESEMSEKSIEQILYAS